MVGPASTPCRAVIIACDRLEPYLSYIRARRPDLFGQARRATPADLPDETVAATPELSPAELSARMAEPSLLCVDTRGSMAYRIGHLPGSVNMPDDYLEDMLRHGDPFPVSRTIVFVCPAGEYSRRLAAFIRRTGRDAVSLAGGVLAWRDAGLPLESGLQAVGLPHTAHLATDLPAELIAVLLSPGKAKIQYPDQVPGIPSPGLSNTTSGFLGPLFLIIRSAADLVICFARYDNARYRRQTLEDQKNGL